MTAKVVPDGCPSVGSGICLSADRTRDVYYAYDLQGHQTAARFDSATGADAVLSSYDGFGNLTSSTTAMYGTNRTIASQFDADGDRTLITHPDGTGFAFNYDGLDRLGQTLLAANGSQLNMKGYDRSGRLASNFGGAQTFGYDGAGRLSTLTIYDIRSSGHTNSYTLGYSPADQLTTEITSTGRHVPG